MANVYHVVVKGDTLSALAVKYKTTVKKLCTLNDIKNPNLIYVGEKLIMSGTAITKKKTVKSMAQVDRFGLQTNTDRTVFATWTWSKDHTKEYKIKWKYHTGNGVWFIGSDTTTTDTQSVYNAPQNAVKVNFNVLPVSKTHKVNKKDTTYWTAAWSTDKVYTFAKDPLPVPSTPSIEIKDFKLTAKLDNIDAKITNIQFQVVKNNSSIFSTGNATVKTGFASHSCTVVAGGEYKVRARSYKGNEYSEWSDYSGSAGTQPTAPAKINSVKALTDTSIEVTWAKVDNAKNYEVEYTTKRAYFDTSGEVKKSTIDASAGEKAILTGLDPGEEWFFRVRATNDNGMSPWTAIVSIILGKPPSAPTTWSSTTTAITGEPVTLYWVHNSEDGSSQTYAQLELTIGGKTTVEEIANTTNEDEKDKTSSKVLQTGQYIEGTKIQWRVRTAGITKQFGDWSIQRTIDVYAPPVLEISLTNKEGEYVEIITEFPFVVKGIAGPSTQTPIGYHVNIYANSAYETIDSVGNVKMVNEGESVYSQYVDTNGQLLSYLTPGVIDLENNIAYTLECTVSMNSGLTASNSLEFTVLWTDMEYDPNAEINVDPDTLVANIRPYCEYFPMTYRKVIFANGVYTLTPEVIDSIDGEPVEDALTTTDEQVYSGTLNGSQVYYCEIESELEELVSGVTLSVYRREFDGTFTELATGIDNETNTFIVDPHPSLDYARYRIVAITNDTGAVSYSDLPGYPINEPAVVIQWAEDWSEFNVWDEDELEKPPWAGSMVKLPFNVDVTDKHASDVSLVEYIGRRHPVSYYGTQLGESASWKVEIDKGDKDTLYALRRLAVYQGDVYVREPSGSGYWANVTVGFSQTHRNLTIPVTLEIKRVEGGA